MNRCPISYQDCDELLYHKDGLKKLSPVLKKLEPLSYSADELRTEAMIRASKMSIQGVQPKLSAILNIKAASFEITDNNGKYILKPQHHIFPEVPENEDISMRIAAQAGIEVPLHGLIYSKDSSLTYFIKRFDRVGHKNKIHIEDFAQLAGMSRDTKYNYSMEKLVGLIDEYCTFPAIEKVKLFKRVIFNFLIGNEDMHLKNYSVIVRNGKVELSPAYDLLNSTILLKGDIEEIALPINGKKSKLNAKILIDYFGKERCGITDTILEKSLDSIKKSIPIWYKLIDGCFLSSLMKEKYRLLLDRRIKAIGWDKG
jgi:serine/threonine-protein kinase HipA